MWLETGIKDSRIFFRLRHFSTKIFTSDCFQPSQRMPNNNKSNHAVYCIGCSLCRSDDIQENGRTTHGCGFGRARHVLLNCRVPRCHYWPTYAVVNTSRRNGVIFYTLKLCRACLFHTIEDIVYNVPESLVIPG